jgi:hypothetical protein
MRYLSQIIPLPPNASLAELLLWLRGEMKKSRFKIWLRAFLFIQFSAIFGVYFFRDISAGYFRWEWVLLIYLLCLPIGFLMSRIVPMRADTESRAVMMSLDRVYLVLIWILVIAKLITGQIPSLVFVADSCMAVILGIMSGRLGGIGIRVRRLKIAAGFLNP